MKELDIRDISIIDAFPVHGSWIKTVLNVGCGEGRIDYYLAKANHQVYATDIKRCETWQNRENLTFHEADIFDLSSFPVASASIVICSQNLEHLREYKTAIAHLLALTETRLIVTVPYGRSFPDSGHVNFWTDNGFLAGSVCNDIHEFITLCAPFSTAISKIRTKPEDVMLEQWGYLVVIDKRQHLMEVKK